MYLIERWQYDRLGERRWTPTMGEARALGSVWADKYHDVVIVEFNDDGSVTEHSVRWQPTPYVGPTKRARITGDKSFHRTPIDCVLPWRYTEDEPSPTLHEGQRYWVVRNEHGSTRREVREAFSGDPWACQCGAWQEIEGIPVVVNEMVAKFPTDA